MEPQEVVQAFVDVFNAGDLDAAASYLSDDFQFHGSVPEPLGTAEFVGMTKALRSGFQDINYNFRVKDAEGDVVKTSTQLSGTNTGDLDFSAMGMGVIPATGKSFSNPEEQNDVTIAGDKITSFRVYTTEGGGIRGILAQLGVQPPGA